MCGQNMQLLSGNKTVRDIAWILLVDVCFILGFSQLNWMVLRVNGHILYDTTKAFIENVEFSISIPWEFA